MSSSSGNRRCGGTWWWREGAPHPTRAFAGSVLDLGHIQNRQGQLWPWVKPLIAALCLGVPASGGVDRKTAFSGAVGLPSGWGW